MVTALCQLLDAVANSQFRPQLADVRECLLARKVRLCPATEGTDRYLGIEVEDALEISDQTEL